MSGVAIRARSLGKRYELGRARRYETLREAIAGSFRRRHGRAMHRSRDVARDPVWALRDVSFEVDAGERVGVIGPNGAGKSTLLKILSRITDPSAGQAEIVGRVGSLLDIGTGFHPELTGRENVYLSGAILGMKRTEIERNFEEIVSFAEVERFLDTPIKHYSDGMQLRLGFAIAAHLETDILLVDEVLAVGDARFQKKCLARISEVAQGQGRTVLFVSHDLGAVQRLCERSLLLEGGRLADAGPTPEVVARYLRDRASATSPEQSIDVSRLPRRGTGEARFISVRYSSDAPNAGFQPYPDGPVEFLIEVDADGAHVVPSFGVVFLDRRGTRLVNADILSAGQELALADGRSIVRLRIAQLHLRPGVYDVNLWMGDTLSVGFDLVESAFQVEVVTLEHGRMGLSPGSEYGSVTSHVSVERL